MLLLLAILFGGYLLATGLTRLRPGLQWTRGFRGRLALAVLFCFTGAAHFFLVEEMAAMIPPFFPAPVFLVYLTGVLEIAGAVGLLLDGFYRWAGYALILFLLAVLPANVYAALNHTGLGGHVEGPSYLWLRVPLQFLLIGWAWYFTRPSVNRRELPTE